MTDLPALDALAPPLKWAGGKRWLLPFLRQIWQISSTRRLVEPFCGGLAVALGLRPDRALLNDINPHLINFYRQLQHGTLTAFDIRNEREAYNASRARFNALIRAGAAETPEAARLFYTLNRTGFNGLCRFNSRGEFNVPFGSYKTIKPIEDFDTYQDAFHDWTFTIGDFDQLAIESDDFIYADPPYDVEFVSYSKEGFSWADQVRLATRLAAHPGPVVVSNQWTDRIVDLYTSSGFTVSELSAPRRISSSGDRTPAREMLAWRHLDIDVETLDHITAQKALNRPSS